MAPVDLNVPVVEKNLKLDLFLTDVKVLIMLARQVCERIHDEDLKLPLFVRGSIRNASCLPDVQKFPFCPS